MGKEINKCINLYVKAVPLIDLEFFFSSCALWGKRWVFKYEMFCTGVHMIGKNIAIIRPGGMEIS